MFLVKARARKYNELLIFLLIIYPTIVYPISTQGNISLTFSSSLCIRKTSSHERSSDFCYNSQSCHLQKFSDDSSAVGCTTDKKEEEYRELIENFEGWCRRNHANGAGRAPQHLFPYRERQGGDGGDLQVPQGVSE